MTQDTQGGAPAYTLKRSDKRKTVAVQVLPTLEVVVRAPRRMPKAEIDRIVREYAAWIEKQRARQRERAAQSPPPGEAEIAALREKARAYIPGRVAQYARMMGLAPTAVKINAARTRYGSCSGKNSLNFSCLLMRQPLEAVDYVIVHELAHIVHKNHGPDFYALIARYMPDHRERRAMLRG